jgi:1,2-diacylglycerol 3-alpha-glucosyltransferase
MKIAFTSDAFYPRTHGIAVAIDASIRYLAQHGHLVEVYAPSYPSTVEREYPSSITIHRFASHTSKLSSNKEERFVYKEEFPRLRELLGAFAPDVIYNHLEFNIGFVARAWAKETNTASIMMVHTYYPPYFKIYAPFLPLAFWRQFIKYGSQMFYKDFDLLLTPSKEMKQVIHQTYKIDQEVEVLPTGIVMENFKGVDRAYELENSKFFLEYPRIKERKRLLFVGRVGNEKNVIFLIKMMRELLKQRSDVELMIAGSGSYRHRYIKLVDKMQLNGNITFMGAHPNTEMKYIYAMADVFVFASLTETQGVVTTEALCNGLPIVAIAALGSISVLENEMGGFLVDKGDIQMFIDRVQILLDNPTIYKEKERQAKERSKELTFEALTGEQMVGIFEKVVARKQEKKWHTP